jgi:hypothetical protein
MRCIRLSWDDVRNGEEVRDELNRRFDDFLIHLETLNPAVLAGDLALPPSAQEGLRQRLREVAQTCQAWAAEQRPLTRENLYREFIVAEGIKPSEAHYDKSKPFARDVKQLIDLKYHCDLPDALAKYPLTPIDSLQRTSLQEWASLQRATETSAEELVELLRQSAFSLAQEGLFVQSIGELNLPEIKA